MMCIGVALPAKSAWPDSLVARQGKLFVSISNLATLVATWLIELLRVLPGGIVILFVLQLFLHLLRDASQDEGLMVSPADGRMVALGNKGHASKDLLVRF